jgi:DNA-binding NarL/FixJ family response regulator
MKIRTLVVDDTHLTLELILSYLEELPAVEIVGAAESGSAAMKLVSTLAPALVLTDLRMPEMDGLELARNLQDLTPAVRVILLTVEQSEPLRNAASACGIRAIVMKDRLQEDLLQEILRVFSDQQ